MWLLGLRGRVEGGATTGVLQNLQSHSTRGYCSCLGLWWLGLWGREEARPCPRPGKREGISFLILASQAILIWPLSKQPLFLSNPKTNGLYRQPRPNRPMAYSNTYIVSEGKYNWWNIGYIALGLMGWLYRVHRTNTLCGYTMWYYPIYSNIPSQSQRECYRR